ncbi:MAG: hypothetical protein OXE78_11700 [Gammaproteobacteria bacterium]|nr:hypothetical protein [Gammaproteobacteria bacterium]MCY4358131.1 hypothetical protein [Gammaproteobacteria bacterium]
MSAFDRVAPAVQGSLGPRHFARYRFDCRRLCRRRSLRRGSGQVDIQQPLRVIAGSPLTLPRPAHQSFPHP